MSITKKCLIIIILLCTLLGFSLGVYYTQQYQVSTLPSPTVPGKSPTTIFTKTPLQSNMPVQSVTPILSATPDFPRIVILVPSSNHCLTDFVDWSSYKDKSLENIRSDIGHTLSSEEKDGFFKTNAQFIGRLSIEGEPIFDHLGFPIYLFEQNEEIYRVSVNPRIYKELEILPSGTIITLFIEVDTYDMHYLSQTLLQDYKLTDNEANIPDFHWSIAIKQNGILFDQSEIAIRNQPFTIIVYLPRLTNEVPIVALNINQQSDWQDNILIGHDTKDNCENNKSFLTPSYPFCPYSGVSFDSDRSIAISSWRYIFFTFLDCYKNNMSQIYSDAGSIVLEKDILNFEIREVDSYVLSEKALLPINEIKKESYILTFFLDINENGIFDDGEIKTIELHISE